MPVEPSISRYNQQLEMALSSKVRGASASLRESAFVDLVIEGLIEQGFLHEPVRAEPDVNLPSYIVAYEVDENRKILTLIVSDYEVADSPTPRRFSPDDLSIRLQKWIEDARKAKGSRGNIGPELSQLRELIGKDNEVAVWVISNSWDEAGAALGLISDLGLYEVVDFWSLEQLGKLLYSPQQFDLVVTNFDDFEAGDVKVLGPFAINGRSIEAYLAVFPGRLLADLYQRNRENLLSENVRGYLSSSGRTNRGILTTIKEEPSHFLAYNNGLSVTASGAELAVRNGSLVLESLTGMHIVNGGQTTASLHFAKYENDSNLDGVWVQAKITVIRDDATPGFVSLIAQYANTQNVVQAANLTSNSRFQKALADKSREVSEPVHGTYWYYERVRNSYFVEQFQQRNVGREDAFASKYPASQIITPTELAKAVMATEHFKPDVAAYGAQKAFREFAALTARKQPTQRDWKRFVALSILWREADNTIQGLDLGGYKSQVLCYTVAYLARKLGPSLDLEKIWNFQTIDRQIILWLQELAPLVRTRLIEDADKANVAMYARKPVAWTVLKQTLEWSPIAGGPSQESHPGLSQSAANPRKILRQFPESYFWGTIYEAVTSGGENYTRDDMRLSFKFYNLIEASPDRISDKDCADAAVLLEKVNRRS